MKIFNQYHRTVRLLNRMSPLKAGVWFRIFGRRRSGRRPPLVVAIVGESGSGKTALSLFLHERGIPAMVSCTTRPMRPGETDGVEHRFMTAGDVPPPEDRLAYTFFGGHHYWTAVSDLDGHDACTYVIDEAGLLELLDRRDRGELRLLYVRVERPSNPTDGDRRTRDACRAGALAELERRRVLPDVTVENTHPDLGSFLAEEGEALLNYIKENA